MQATGNSQALWQCKPHVGDHKNNTAKIASGLWLHCNFVYFVGNGPNLTCGRDTTVTADATGVEASWKIALGAECNMQ